MDAYKLSDIQRQVHEWTSQFTPQYWPAEQVLTRLAEEVGEVARQINHLHGFKKKKADEATKQLGDELADVVFTLACMAGTHGMTMEPVRTDYVETNPYPAMAELIKHQGYMADIILRNETVILPACIGAMLNVSEALASMHGIDLAAEFDRVMKEKHYGRDQARFEKKV